ncbi:MAG TPA: shikimate kinase [Candidatus Solibacter sp.]|nr:shikimate kinase [Candidatus Solibacter sp.]
MMNGESCMTGSSPTRRSVFLVGFMGAGKSTVGQALASRLGWAFYDLDLIIEERERTSVADLFAAAGEAGFRELERVALADLLENELRQADSVVALGGGTFAQAENRKILRRFEAMTVLLNAPLEELRRRCNESGGQRPLAREGAQFEQLFESRRGAYNLADFQVETGGKAVEDVVAEIEQWISTANSDQVRKAEVRQ